MSDSNTPALIRCGPAEGVPLVWTPSRVVRGTAEQRAWVLYEDATGQFAAGIWECDEGCWEVHYTESEFFQMLEGRIRIVDANARIEEVAAGESFIVPAGFRGTWEVLVPARKYFVTFETKAIDSEP